MHWGYTKISPLRYSFRLFSHTIQVAVGSLHKAAFRIITVAVVKPVAVVKLNTSV